MSQCFHKLYVEHIKTLIKGKKRKRRNEREETEVTSKAGGPVQYVTREEMAMAPSKMSNGKTRGPSEVSAELLKDLGEYGIY